MKKTERENQSQVRSGQVEGRLSFRDALEAARAQIDLGTFAEHDRDFADELVKNVAEIYMLPDAAPVRIGSRQLAARNVREVFAELTEEHVKFVIGNFRVLPYQVRHVKSYLRTALYNSVFELDAAITNRVAAMF